MKFETDFDALCRDLSALTEGVPYVIANLANTRYNILTAE